MWSFTPISPYSSTSWSVVGLSIFLFLINHDECCVRNSVFRKRTESGSDQGRMLKNKALPTIQRPTSPVLQTSNTNGLLFLCSERRKEETARYGERAIAVEVAERKQKVRKKRRNTAGFSALLHYHCRHTLFPANQFTFSGHRVCRLASAESNQLSSGSYTLQCAPRRRGIKKVQKLVCTCMIGSPTRCLELILSS